MGFGHEISGGDVADSIRLPGKGIDEKWGYKSNFEGEDE